MHDMTKQKSNIIMPPQAAATSAPALSSVRLERRTAYKLRAESTEYACEIYKSERISEALPKHKGGRGGGHDQTPAASFHPPTRLPANPAMNEARRRASATFTHSTAGYSYY